MRNLHVYGLAAVLAAIGLGLFVYKAFVVGLPLRAAASATAWQVESEFHVTAAGGPLKIALFVPEDQRNYSVLDQRLAAPDFGQTTAPQWPNRQLILTMRAADGEKAVRQRVMLHRTDGRGPLRQAPPPVPQQVTLNPTAQTIAHSLFSAAHAKSSDDISLVSVLLRELSATDRSQNVRSLIGDDRSAQKIAATAAQILRVNGRVARAVHGFDLAKTGISVVVLSWLEVHIGDRWRSFAIPSGEPRIPISYFAWWRGDEPFVKVEGGKLDRRRISVALVEQHVLRQVLTLGKRDKSFLTNYSFYGLPPTQRQVFRIIMTIPIGVFLLVVLRNLVGLRGVGTFMPVLIALAFRETQLLWGLALFTVVLAAGLLVRQYFDNLRLLLVARLAALLMFVILLMAAITILSDKLDFERGLSVALFPLVILTMTIERISVLWDERGPAEAIRMAVMSLVTATLCYLVMSAPSVQHIFFTFPELILVLMAATLLIGRYTGYRLTELARFKVLVPPN
jgi:hypothetical protein